MSISISRKYPLFHNSLTWPRTKRLTGLRRPSMSVSTHLAGVLRGVSEPCKSSVTAGKLILWEEAGGGFNVIGAAGLSSSAGRAVCETRLSAAPPGACAPLDLEHLCSSSRLPRCFPMLLIINASLPFLTTRVAATAPRFPRRFFVGCAGSPFNMLIFLGAPPSACTHSSVSSWTDFSKRTATGTH
jgi:hypothetical protein